MNEDYKFGYQDGRYEVLQELERELSRQKEPLFQKILSDGSVDECDSARLEAINILEDWRLEQMGELEDD